MKLAHNIKASVFSYQGEDEQAILEKLLAMFPFEIKKQLKKTKATTHDDLPILIFEVELVKEREVNGFLNFLVEKLSKDQKELLVKQMRTRLDNELNFFLRLDKEKLMNGEYWITDSGNCYHIKILLAAYPKKKEVGEMIIRKIFI